MGGRGSREGMSRLALAEVSYNINYNRLAIRDTDASLNVQCSREDKAWYQIQLRQSTFSIVSNRALHLSINRKSIGNSPKCRDCRITFMPSCENLHTTEKVR